MLKLLFELASRLPLGLLHTAGVALGWLAYGVSPPVRQRLRGNLRQAGYDDPALLRAAVRETGKSLAELPAVWFRPQAEAAALMHDVDGSDLLDAAHAAGKGIIFVTPHLGCFEVTAQWYTQHHGPMTALFTPPRKSALALIVMGGRGKENLKLAAPTFGGVRTLLRALHKGEAVGILPDQVPGRGEGEWADFFGRPAYTMSLVDRLAEVSGATVILAYAERLPHAAGYRGYVSLMPPREDGESAARHLNRALEDLIRRCPSQYLWSYNRYKTPGGVAPPPPVPPPMALSTPAPETLPPPAPERGAAPARQAVPSASAPAPAAPPAPHPPQRSAQP